MTKRSIMGVEPGGYVRPCVHEVASIGAAFRRSGICNPMISCHPLADLAFLRTHSAFFSG